MNSQLNQLEVPRILIIDDTHAIHDDFRKILTRVPSPGLDKATAALFGPEAVGENRTNFALDSAHQGNEGLEFAQRAMAEGRPYAIAFVDIRMPPGWDGVETTSKLWEVDPDLQVVICTAYSDFSWDELTRRLGRSDSLVILKKPFDTVEVLQLAHALARKWFLTLESKRRLQSLDNLVMERTKELHATNERLVEEIAMHRRAETGLRTSEERYRRLVELSPDAIFVECEGRIAFVNSAGIKLFGGTRREDILGKAVLDLIHPDYRETDAQRMTRLRKSRATAPLIEEKYLRLDGGAVDVEVTATPFALENKPAAQVIARDITGRKALEQQLRQSQKMEAIGQLAGGVAHDFNNLLTVIRGNAEVALMDATRLPDQSVECLKQVTAAADRAARLTRQLLAFGRKQIIQPQPLNLNEVIVNLTKMLKRIIGEDIQLQCTYAARLPLVQADVGMVEQVLVNLVVNARDAMPRGGQLLIQTEQTRVDAKNLAAHPKRRAGEFVSVEVADTGSGIAPEHLPRIFEPFFTTKAPGKGTGLGLATVSGIVEQHKGWFEVSSRVGSGSRFKIYFPSTGHFPAAKSQTEAELKPCGGTERILLVEDDEAVRSLTRRHLESAGYRVREASAGHEALALWPEHGAEIDLLLTDIIMPQGINGRELAEQLCAQRPELKVVFMSGYCRDENSGSPSVSHRPASPFLQKPFPSHELLQIVRQCLDQK